MTRAASQIRPDDEPRAAPLRPDLAFAADFMTRASAMLLAEPLDPAQDRLHFGCHVIAGAPPDPALIANAKPAAVLVPVIERPAGLSVLLTERAAHLSAHAGQVAFPGGRIEPGESPVAAALRESYEEIGLAPAAVRPIGFLPPYFSGTGYRVQPLVGLVPSDVTFRPDPSEVARVFEVPLADMLDLACYKESTIFFQGRERRFYILDNPASYIWGVTAGIMRSFAERY